MNTTLVLEGLGLCVMGLALLVISRWYVRDDARMRQLAERRWWFDRRFESDVRRGTVTKEEWFEILARRQRAIVKWAVSPCLVLWVGLCVAVVVSGLAGG
ncbi:MAG: hypothetical protein ACLQNG_18100 [Acidimicrobiales bacterium]|jgi:hypothetical protein